ncbi:uncharacterized protein LOC124153964 [Ischnura elegans]|uniref:uncharacterized protein LOC124153964 n=1 Tax=Ischnura elegans TaxID=197161 RepID=UPI001ED87BF8|nr:uncharacterized protein LOC124153964 [Ischnura elegans]XP_046383354.1 uncharacterized protein LOC124153964 [Ischnura elegans]XP_046383355.1 uncharacterized protein LOC124153964 [Ischnura elegans]
MTAGAGGAGGGGGGLAALLLAAATLALAATTPSRGFHLCDAPRALLSLPGDAVITGLFDGHSGPNCTDPLASGLQQMAGAAWAVNALNDIAFVTGVKLGLTIYDACSSPDAARTSLVTALVEQECDDAYPLGVVTTSRISGYMRPLTDALGPLSPLVTTVAGGPPSSILANASVAILRALNWTEAAVAAASPRLLRTFMDTATDEGLCISGQALLPRIPTTTSDAEELEWEVDETMRSLPESAAVILAGPWKGIQTLLEISGRLGFTERRDWIVMPTEVTADGHNMDDDEESEAAFDLESSVAELAELTSGGNALLVLPQFGDIQLLEGTLSRWRQSVVSEEADDVAIRSVPPAALLDVAGGVLSFARRLVEALGPSKTLADLPPRSLKHGTAGDSNTEILAAAETLHLSAEEATMARNPLILSRVTADGQLVELGVYESSSGLRLSDSFEEDMSKWTRGVKHSCRNCRRCINLEGPGLGIYWRGEGWVAAVVTLSATGVLCSLAVIVYLIVRMFKTTPLEGNPALSFVMLLAVILTYSAVVPYAVNAPRPIPFSEGWDGDEEDAATVAAVVCTMRLLCPSMAYALLFSTMLSRCIMLASSDSEGFLSHVSGPLQTALLFFMAAVQVGLTVEFWLLVLVGNSAAALASASEPCAPTPSGRNKLFFYLVPLMSYDALLLLILTVVSPFAAKSRRNYREGALLAVASASSLIVWLGWGAAFVAAPTEWRDASVAGGLVATASAVLLGLFIPRTYLMTSAAARDRMASALPPLAAAGGISGTSILDLNYRASNQALYDSVGQGLHRSQEILRSPMLNSGLGAGSSTTALVRATSANAVGQSNPSYYATERPDTPVSIRGPAARGGTNPIPEGSGEASLEDSPIGGRLMRIDSIDSETYERYGAKPSPHKVTRF